MLDCGTYTEESTDYPDYAAKVCQAINTGEAERVFWFVVLVLVFIVANKIHGIRAACAAMYFCPMSREHNANVLCMGERYWRGLAEMITDTWV